MTLEEVENAIERFRDGFVEITLTKNRTIEGVLTESYPGIKGDPRGYERPYFYVVRIDIPNNPTEKYDCEEAIKILSIKK